MDGSSRVGHEYSGVSASGGYNVFGDVNQYAARPAPPESPLPPSTINVPRLDGNFIDRVDIRERLHGRASAKGAWVALTGFGGAGKTQSTVKYVRDLREKDESLWILWVFAARTARFDESIRDVAEQIRLAGRRDPKADVLGLLRTWLADARRRWVIVFDNADDAAFLLDPPPAADGAQSTKRRIDHFRGCDHGTVIITSRYKHEARKFVEEDDIIDVNRMNMEQATALLSKKLGSQCTEDNAAQLATALDLMPLALSQAASFLKQRRRYTVEKYLAELEKNRETRISLLRKVATVPDRDRDASDSIMLTWQISFEYIHNKRKSAADLLALMSFCDRQGIPELLLHDIKVGEHRGDDAEIVDEELCDENFDDDIQMLEDFSFVSTTNNTSTWEMHRLVQDAMQSWLLEHGLMKEAKYMFIRRLHKVMPDGKFENWEVCRMLLPHVKSVPELDYEDREISSMWTQVMLRAAMYAAETRKLKDAENFTKKVLMRYQDHPKADPFEITSCEVFLAWVYFQQGRFEEVEVRLARSLETLIKTVGVENFQAINVLQRFVALYIAQDRLTKAEVLSKRLTEILTRSFGEAHHYTLRSMRILASIRSHQGRASEAETLITKILKIRTSVLGEESSITLAGMKDLASIYLYQGLLDKAEPLLSRRGEIRTRVLGEEHPDTLRSRADIAYLYYRQGRASDAVILYEKILKIRMRVLGEEHSDTLQVMNNLAAIHNDQGRQDEAEALCARMLEIERRELGERNPETLKTIFNLAIVRCNQKRYREAFKPFEQRLQSRNMALGEEHRDTVKSAGLVQRIKEELGDTKSQGAEEGRDRLEDGRPDSAAAIGQIGQVDIPINESRSARSLN